MSSNYPGGGQPPPPAASSGTVSSSRPSSTSLNALLASPSSVSVGHSQQQAHNASSSSSPGGVSVSAPAAGIVQAYNTPAHHSLAIRQEIQRFESVHPSIYAIYDLIELIPDPLLAQQIREHVVCIEDSFVNSQEWTLSRGVPDIRLGIVGSLSSGKSALVHRYLTGSYMQEESPEGGRFKKEVVVDGQSYLLLIRDEGGPPELQFSAWVDAVVFVFSLENEASFNAIYNYFAKMSQYRNMSEIPLILVGTQDAISENHPRLVDEFRARKMAADLGKCAYFETCATYGLNVERVFQDACYKITQNRNLNRPSSPVVSHQHQQLHNSHPRNNSYGNMAASMATTPRSSYPNSAGGDRGYHLPSPGSGGGGTTNGMMVSSPSGHQLSQHSPGSNYHKFVGGSDSGGKTFVSSVSQQFVHSSPSDFGKFVIPSSLNSSGGPGGGAHMLQHNNNGDNKENAPSAASAPASAVKTASAADLPTPSSTPTSARKNRRRSNLFAPHKKEDKNQVGLMTTPQNGGQMGQNGGIPPHSSTASLLKGQPEVGSGRSIPIRQGYLYKKSSKGFSSKEWKKKYVTLSDGRLTYHPSLQNYMENVHSKEIPLSCVTVKVPGQRPRGSRSIPSSSSQQLEAGGGEASSSASSNTNNNSFPNSTSTTKIDKRTGEKVMLTGFEMIRDPSGSEEQSEAHNTTAASTVPEKETPNVKKRHRRIKSNGLNKNDCEETELFEFHIVSLDNKQWHFEASSAEEREEWVEAIEQQILSSLQGNQISKSNAQPGSGGRNELDLQIIKTIRHCNNRCVDCDAPNPDWASINLGVLMCIECSGVHRQLGSHITRVRSLDLDEWPPGHLATMTALGNLTANSIWEANMRGIRKPTAQSPQSDKERFIMAKYKRKEFIMAAPKNLPNIHAYLIESICKNDVKGVSLALAHANEEDVNAKISLKDSRTALHLASSLGSLPIVQLLIWSNANVRCSDHEGRTCLSYARAAGQAPDQLIELLIANGCVDGAPAASASSMSASVPSTGASAASSSNMLNQSVGSSNGTLNRRRHTDVFDKISSSVI